MEGFIVTPKHANDDSANKRRTANYKPNIWDYEFVQSLQSKFLDTCKRRVEKLKMDMKHLLVKHKEMVPLADQLDLIDDIQRLGLQYHFEKEIKEALDELMSFLRNGGRLSSDDDLHSTALCFRLLRQYGYFVSQDQFSSFMDETDNFRTSLSQDIKGMLSLYEASHLAIEGETVMEKAKAFSTRTLKDLIIKRKFDHDPHLAQQIAHALEVPSHCRVPWVEARWYTHAYESKNHLNSKLLELAKLNFNMVQATHQGELKEIYRWWKEEGLAEKLSFARHRLVECFLWSVGSVFGPQYGNLRKWLTKIINLIILIDDAYDIYGSMDELEYFTDAVERWDEKKIDHLPEYMKICFLTLHGTTIEICSGVQNDQKMNIMTHIKKVWIDFCKALMLEAKWYSSGYSPSLREYLDNARISSSGEILLVHGYFALAHEKSNQVVGFLETNQDFAYHPSLIIRLCNDLGTSAAELERGDAPSSILCYMREAQVSEEIAREHIKGMITESWKRMNEKCITHSSQLPLAFVTFTYNIARVAHFIYQHGDGFGVQDRETKTAVSSLLVQSI